MEKNEIKTSKEIFELFQESLQQDNTGEIFFSFNGIKITVTTKDVMGGVLQEWFGSWLKHNKIFFKTKENTQEFPDFIINDTIHNGMLEFKSFDLDRSPNFDVANFDAYRRSLLTDSYRLDADYIIVGYRVSNTGKITIEKVWLKKIWELCTTSDRFALKTQCKQNIIINIRPAVWYSDRVKYKPFNSKEEFLQAFYKTIKKYDSPEQAEQWLDAVIQNYYEHTGTKLNIKKA